MIVGEPRLTTTDTEVRVEADCSFGPSRGGLPPSLWFAFPRAYERFVAESSDAFAAALLPLAMSLGEPLVVEGTVSSRLAAGMREYQRIQSVWKTPSRSVRLYV